MQSIQYVIVAVNLVNEKIKSYAISGLFRYKKLLFGSNILNTVAKAIFMIIFVYAKYNSQIRFFLISIAVLEGELLVILKYRFLFIYSQYHNSEYVHY